MAHPRGVIIYEGAAFSIMMNHDKLPVTHHWKGRHTTVSLRVIITGSVHVFAIDAVWGWGPNDWNL